MVKRFIQRAIKHPGALRAEVSRMYGSKGFVSKGARKGDIKKNVLRELEKKPGITGRRARLAETLGKLRKRR